MKMLESSDTRLVVDLDENKAYMPEGVIKLSPVEAEIISVLSSGERMAREQAHRKIFGAYRPFDPDSFRTRVAAAVKRLGPCYRLDCKRDGSPTMQLVRVQS
jgi:hypothetical protein